MADSSFPMNVIIHMITLKLSSSNYLLWKKQIVPMLTCADLYGLVDGTSTASAATDTTFAAWKSKDQKPSDELVFGTPTTCVGSQILQDPTIYDDDALRSEPNFINFSTDGRVDSGLTRKSDERDQSNGKKVVHRDTERKRRKEMSNLHLNLASLLPIQQSKGKRAVCDQMQEATNYIKNMENKIEELKIRRDKLVKSSENNKVVINSSGSDGMEIVIKSGDDDYYGISRALEELAQMEVDVVNCLSTRISNPGPGFLHKIQIQGMDMRSLGDVSVLLQHKLSNIMK